jgi:hypothetical protein
MVNTVLYFYLFAPVVLGAAAFLYAVTRAKDRIQLATMALFLASFMYFTQAYELTKAGGESASIGVVLGVYSLTTYGAMAALGIYLKQWAWRASLAVFAVHAELGIFGASTALAGGIKGVAALAAYFGVAAIGTWSLLHRGTREAVASRLSSEA